MTIHIKKLCVGVDNLDQLRDWQTRKGVKGPGGVKVVRHVTRATPKRSEEVLNGGSLYWVIKGWILARNKILGLEPVEDHEGRRKCAIILEAGPIEVIPTKHRPFQGWRYLDAEEAPKDLNYFKGKNSELIPPDLASKLNELGLL